MGKLTISMAIFNSKLLNYQSVTIRHLVTRRHLGMDQYLLIPFLGGWTSINPSYFDVNRRGTRFWHTAWQSGVSPHGKIRQNFMAGSMAAGCPWHHRPDVAWSFQHDAPGKGDNCPRLWREATSHHISWPDGQMSSCFKIFKHLHLSISCISLYLYVYPLVN